MSRSNNNKDKVFVLHRTSEPFIGSKIPLICSKQKCQHEPQRAPSTRRAIPRHGQDTNRTGLFLG